MADPTPSRKQEAADLARAPAAAPATATIVPDAPQIGASRSAGEDDEPDLPERPEIEPGQAPETNPDLQPIIPPVETPTI